MNENTLILPPWAERLRQGYLSGEASQFLLHSNVGDLVEWRQGGSVEYITLREFLVRFLARTKDTVLFYNVTEGMGFADPGMRTRFQDRVNLVRKARGHPEWSGVTPSLPSQALGLVGEFITDRKNRGAVVLDYVETLVPEGDLSYLSSEDRSCLVALQQWSGDPGLMASDNIVIMIAESLAEVHRKIRSQPQVMSIRLGLPDTDERARFIDYSRDKYQVEGPETKDIADMTGGLSRIQIESIFKNCADSKEPLRLELVSEKKKEVIERECMGLVEVIEGDYGFESVGGLSEVKDLLLSVADSIRQGRVRRIPMGIMLVGPMGTGKSFLAEAFARESGLTCVKLKGFREKWVGSTESNLERVLGIIQALGNVLVIVDEADRNLSTDVHSSDSGTESRVMARLKEFMSDTGHR
ncbi:MAG: ATP-binding protein, partial [bacterium]